VTALFRVHVATDAVRGVATATGRPWLCPTGELARYTDELLTQLAGRPPSTTTVLVSQTGLEDANPVEVTTPAGLRLVVRGIRTDFPALRDRKATADCYQSDPQRVELFYERLVADMDNPVYGSLALQYARNAVVMDAPLVLALRVTALVSLLKAEEFGLLTPAEAGRHHLVAVLRDDEIVGGGADERLAYVRDRLALTQHAVTLVAASDLVADRLRQLGVDDEDVRIVPGGLDLDAMLDTAPMAVA
jgi:hypothetical protein